MNHTKSVTEKLCIKGHSYEPSVNFVTHIEAGCGYCSNRSMWPVSEEQYRYSLESKIDLIDPLRNDMLVRYPNLSWQLDNPRDALTASSRFEANGVCKKNLHKIRKSLRKFHTCSYCSGKLVTPLSDEDRKIIFTSNPSHKIKERNDLFKFYPKESLLLKDMNKAFEVTRNQNISLDCVCSNGHEWTISNTAAIRSGCLLCPKEKNEKPNKQRQSKTRKAAIPFKIDYPEIYAIWDFDLNNRLDPDDYSFGSNQKVWWKNNDCGHSWNRSIKMQIKISKCKICSPRESAQKAGKMKLSKSGLIAEKLPDLAKEFSSKNDKDISEYYVNSSERVLWDCRNCHNEWEADVAQRALGKSKCPYCSGRKLASGLNDIETLAPHLKEDWFDETPMSEVRAKTSEKYKWKCRVCSHIWMAAPTNRFNGQGCIKCYTRSKVSKGQKALSQFVSSLDVEIIENAKGFETSRMELDIFIPDLKLAIEYNGDYWHSDKVTMKRWGKTAEDRHLEKQRLCAEIGIKLVFVWENDWFNNRSEVEQSISNFVKTGEIEPILKKNVTEIEPRESTNSKVEIELYARPMTLEKRELVISKYLDGESPGNFFEELRVSKDECYSIVKELDLITKRAELGLGKFGETILKPSQYDEFRADCDSITQKEIMDKYSLTYKVFMRTFKELKTI